jgi:hypothetical protein
MKESAGQEIEEQGKTDKESSKKNKRKARISSCRRTNSLHPVNWRREYHIKQSINLL